MVSLLFRLSLTWIDVPLVYLLTPLIDHIYATLESHWYMKLYILGCLYVYIFIK